MATAHASALRDPEGLRVGPAHAAAGGVAGDVVGVPGIRMEELAEADAPALRTR